METDQPDRIDSGERDLLGGPAGQYRSAALGRQDGSSIYHTIERVTDLMERAIRIPGTQIRVGLDPIIGLLFPEGGDVVGAVVSICLILASVRHGLPKGVIAKMVFNVTVDYLIGSVPVIGDMFDFAWKSNSKNLELLKKHGRGIGSSFWSDWGWAVILLSLFGGIVIGIAAVSIYLIRQFLGSFSGWEMYASPLN